MCHMHNMPYMDTSFVPGIHSKREEHDSRKNAWFQLFAHAQNFPRNLGNCVILVFFHVRITHNHVILGILLRNDHL